MSSDDDLIEVGGSDRLPEYPRRYLEAARRLVEGNRTDLALLALPIVYLQRHCLELIMKEVHLASSFLAAVKGGTIEVSEWHPVGHCLVELARKLGDSLAVHGIEMPEELDSLVRDMSAIEAGVPDRYRYAFLKWTKEQKQKGNWPEESFPTPQRIPLRQFQRRLEALILIADVRVESSLTHKLYAQCTGVLNECLASGSVTFDSKIFAMPDSG